ncbi:amino acid adenylation domain-containing protein, partial [Streptomyces clavuligerus]
MEETERTVPTVPQLFEAVAGWAGDETAVVFRTAAVSYAELNTAANRLARCLVDRGVGPDMTVAVSVPRSIELPTVLLAVLKAGGAYLALDPDYPAERLSAMVADARPLLHLRTAELALPAPAAGVDGGADGADAAHAVDVLDVVIDDPVFRAECAARSGDDLTDAERRAPLLPAHLMYLVYTSGSTGRPKGVAVSHAGVSALVEGQHRHLAPGPGDRVLQWAATGFDASFWDLSLALFSGATLVLAPAADLLPGQPLRDTLARHRVTHATLPPVALSVTEPDGVLTGGAVVSTGDALSPALARAWSAGRRLFNGYGPTEVTVGISVGQVTGDEEIGVGRPLPGSSVQVLDSRLRPVDPGAEGELYLSGPGLARGYLNRAAETATRFVADPAGPPGSRMYRSGDRGRRRADGELFFTGRADHQVKVRGFRVELDEVEARLTAHPSVGLACALVEGDLATARVVAYVTLREGARPPGGTAVDSGAAAAELRRHAARTLPGHMVPSRVTVLDHFPTTPNGKIDRAALPTVRPGG